MRIIWRLEGARSLERAPLAAPARVYESRGFPSQEARLVDLKNCEIRSLLRSPYDISLVSEREAASVLYRWVFSHRNVRQCSGSHHEPEHEEGSIELSIYRSLLCFSSFVIRNLTSTSLSDP